MLEDIKIMFSYGFMIRAIVAGVLVSVCSGILGVNLVLRRYSMIGDGLSHIGFGALAIGAALNLTPLKIAIPAVILAALLLLGLKRNSKIKGDAAIAVISTGALSIGVLAVSLSGGVNIDLNSYLFGSILAVTKSDLLLSIVLSAVVFILYSVFYHTIFDISFDGDFAAASGTKTAIGNIVIAVLTAITVVLGMRLMGTLLISALIVFPSMSAMRISGKFKNVVILSAVFSAVCFLAGMTVSFRHSLPTGATVVCTNMAVLIVSVIYEKLKGKIFKNK